MKGCIYRTKDGECDLYSEGGKYHAFCVGDEPCEGRKQTNADRIRAMTDEELAEWAWSVESDGRAYGPRGKKAWLDWLKQEVTNNITT